MKPFGFFEVAKDPEATAAVQAWLDSPRVEFVGRRHGSQEGTATWNKKDPSRPLVEQVPIYTHQILNELCNRDLLPEGDLMVHVWW